MIDRKKWQAYTLVNLILKKISKIGATQEFATIWHLVAVPPDVRLSQIPGYSTASNEWL